MGKKKVRKLHKKTIEEDPLAMSGDFGTSEFPESPTRYA